MTTRTGTGSRPPHQIGWALLALAWAFPSQALAVDSDGDGIEDADEALLGTDPLVDERVHLWMHVAASPTLLVCVATPPRAAAATAGGLLTPPGRAGLTLAS